MDVPELTAYVSELTALDETLALVLEDDWAAPGLGAWSVHELCAHLHHVVTRFQEYATVEAAGGPTQDRLSYYRYDPTEDAPIVEEAARTHAAELPTAGMGRRMAEAWRHEMHVLERLAPQQLIATPFGTIPAVELLATRVLEVTVHHMDLRVALGLPPTSTPAAARVTAALLEGLLGAPAPRGLGRARFIRVATGRLPSEDARFPVLG